MSQAVRKQKINKRLEGQACGHCGDALSLGEDGAVCEACNTPHHERCWDEKMGCGGPPDCPNIPLPDFDEKTTRHLRDDEKVCPHCEKVIYVGADICRHCNKVVTEDGVYRGEKTTESHAKLSLLFAVFGFLSCVTPLTSLLALALGPLAIVNGWRARRRIASDERLRGKVPATAGLLLGGLDILVCFIAFSSLPPDALSGIIYSVSYWSGYCCIPFLFVVVLFFLIRRRR